MPMLMDCHDNTGLTSRDFKKGRGVLGPCPNRAMTKHDLTPEVLMSTLKADTSASLSLQKLAWP